MKDLAVSILAGDRNAIANALSIVENDVDLGNIILDALFPHTGKAHIIGITGPPGTGKSMLVNHLAGLYRHPAEGKYPCSVGIIAIDPSSPFTGGAILGDRVRMRDLAGDNGVFIRSMASRGSLGGLAQKTYAAAQVMDAAGFDIIIIETVGAGQSEVNIIQLAQTVIVVEAPGLGDDIQVIKAGILEIADIIVVNKADLDGADNTERYLKTMLDLANKSYDHEMISSAVEPAKNPPVSPWIPPVKKTIALTGDGMEVLIQIIKEHSDYLKSSGEWNTRQRIALSRHLLESIKEELYDRWQGNISKKIWDSMVDQVCDRKISPRSAILELLKKSR
jgi:LAO/AO transport system kinase